MRKNNGVTTIGVAGAIIIVFSLCAFFLLDIEKIALYWWALAFLLLSELVLCLGLIGLRFLGADHSKAFSESGIATVLSLYFFATLISVLFVGSFKDRLNTFIVLELGIIALSAVLALSVLAFSRKIAESDRRTFKDQKLRESGEKSVAKRGGF